MAYGTLAAISDATKNFAIDLISGTIFTRGKIAWGDEGVANEVTSAAGLPVALDTSSAAAIGATNETAPVSDIAAAGLNGRMQRVAQRLSTLIGLLPGSLGAKAAAASFAVTNSTEDAAAIGAVTEAAPASDTASSGLNGRMQRIAQRLTSIIGLLPGALANGRLKIALRDAADAELGTTTNPLYTSPVGATVTLVDRSGTITVGGTQQQLAAANAARRGLWVQNNSAGDLRINSTGNASATSGILLPGGQNALYEYPSSGVPVTGISIWGATIGQAFESREW